MELVLPKKTVERSHGFKYRLYFGNKEGECLIRYDNEAGKGDHKHIGQKEEKYKFISRDKLIEDFYHDILKSRHKRGFKNE